MNAIRTVYTACWMALHGVLSEVSAILGYPFVFFVKLKQNYFLFRRQRATEN